MKRTTLLLALGLSLCLSGCKSPQEVGEARATITAGEAMLETLNTEMAGLRADLETISATDPDAQETADALIALLEEKGQDYERWVGALTSAYDTASTSDNAWGWLEAIAGAAAVFVPGAGIALPIIRRSRNAFDGVVAAIEEGGGPVNKDATRTAMNLLGIKDRVTASRVSQGFKTIEAVKAS